MIFAFDSHMSMTLAMALLLHILYEMGGQLPRSGL